MRARKRVAVQTRVDGGRADLVHHPKVAHVQVDVGFDGQLAHRAHDREARGHRAGAACSIARGAKRGVRSEIAG